MANSLKYCRYKAYKPKSTYRKFYLENFISLKFKDIIMQKIILDTNFLLYVVRNRIDLFGELDRILDINYKVCFLDKSLDELKGKKLGKLASVFAKKYLKIIKTKKGKVDDLLLEQNSVIATMDKELMEKLKKKKRQVIIIRQKKYLKFY